MAGEDEEEEEGDGKGKLEIKDKYMEFRITFIGKIGEDDSEDFAPFGKRKRKAKRRERPPVDPQERLVKTSR